MAEKIELTVDDFIEESRKLLGKPIRGVTEIPTNEVASYRSIRNFAWALGDDNPLYTDPEYAARGRYGMLIAPPTFLTTVKYPISQGVLFDGPYPLVGLDAGFSWDWFDVIRINDKLTGEAILKDVFEQEDKADRQVFLVTELTYWNHHKELVATGNGTFVGVAREKWDKTGFRKDMIYDRPVHHWSREDIEHIVVKGIESEKRRGAQPRYWEEVNVGDQLTPVVKGPLSLMDLINYFAVGFNCVSFPCFELLYRKLLTAPSFTRQNLRTGWPYEMQMSEHCDENLCKGAGMRAIFDWGVMRAGLATHLLFNWMGDDGFLRRMNIEISKPFIYGDVLWFKGEVVNKYRVTETGPEGEEEYGAVDVKIEAVNQLNENTTPGKATIYLPSPGLEVKLPIPC